MATDSIVRDLVQTLEDGRKGFSEAGDRLAEDGHTDLARRFRQFAEQRERFSAELRAEAAELGVPVEAEGTLAGALHRGWIDLRDALTGGDPEAILDAVEAGENHAVQEYERALAADELPDAIAEVVQRQADEVRRVREAVVTRELAD